MQIVLLMSLMQVTFPPFVTVHEFVDKAILYLCSFYHENDIPFSPDATSSVFVILNSACTTYTTYSVKYLFYYLAIYIYILINYLLLSMLVLNEFNCKHIRKVW